MNMNGLFCDVNAEWLGDGWRHFSIEYQKALFVIEQAFW